MTAYSYVSVISVTDMDGNQVNPPIVVLGKKENTTAFIEPFIVGKVNVCHVRKLPYRMNEVDAWHFINTYESDIYDIVKQNSIGHKDESRGHH
jgi:hypothetical protein